MSVLPDIAKQIDDMVALDIRGNAVSLQCEIEDNGITSPPEQVFYAAWHMAEPFQKFSIGLLPQHPITTPTGKFRADFLVAPMDFFINVLVWHDLPDTLVQAFKPDIVVEIDGHRWHEKTHDQVEKDKQRERAIVAAEYRVVRFTAREVFREPFRCVNEVWSLVERDLLPVLQHRLVWKA